MRKSWFAVLALALALSLVAGTSAAAEGPEEAAPAGQFGCNTGHACVWPSTFFTGTIGESLFAVGTFRPFELGRLPHFHARIGMTLRSPAPDSSPQY